MHGRLFDVIKKHAENAREFFEKELVIDGKTVPRGSLALINPKHKSDIITLLGHTVPLGEVKRLPGNVELRFTDLVEENMFLIVPPMECPTIAFPGSIALEDHAFSVSQQQIDWRFRTLFGR